MNMHREYFLRHMGIGEQWILRKTEDAQPVIDLNSVSNPTESVEVSATLSRDQIVQLREAISVCHECRLCSTNGKWVLPDQVFNAEVLVVYDWSEEDSFDIQRGADFKKLLVNMLKSITIEPSRIASLSLLNANFPTSNLSIPMALSAQFCGDFLRRSIALGKAKYVLIFGARTANALFDSTQSIEQLRSTSSNFAGIPVVVTYSPYQLLEQASLKREVWKDLCRFQSAIES